MELFHPRDEVDETTPCGSAKVEEEPKDKKKRKREIGPHRRENTKTH
jgi:hypothetical protein